jgi:hypothetical protein
MWFSKSALRNRDYIWVTVISSFGLLSFGCWAGALAGAMIATTGGSGRILLKAMSSEQALAAAREYVGYAYSLFVITVIASGIYYLLPLRTR